MNLFARGHKPLFVPFFLLLGETFFKNAEGNKIGGGYFEITDAPVIIKSVYIYRYVFDDGVLGAETLRKVSKRF